MDSRSLAKNSPGKLSSVLVMGGLGFIGSHLCRSLLEYGYRVRIFDKLYTSHSLVLDIEEEVDILESDIQKPHDVLEALSGIDIVVDLIHTTVPGSSMQNPVYDVQSNIASHVNWLSRLSDSEVKKIIYISSGGTVYGIPQAVPIRETHPTNPISSYGITKLTIEKYVAMYANLYGIEYRICRPANAYGEGQRLHIGQGVIGVFLDRTIRGLPIEIWGSGDNKRDYIYISDLVDAILSIMEYTGDERTFNVSTAVGYSLNDLVDLIKKNLNLDMTVQYKPSRGFDVPANILDNKLLMEQTGWLPKVDIDEGISRFHNLFAH